MTTFFMPTWWWDSKNMEEIVFSRWLFEGRPRQGKNVLPEGLNWLRYFAGSSKSHRENSISCRFLESPHQVDMKNVVQCYKHFFGYFNALETNSAPPSDMPAYWVAIHCQFQSWFRSERLPSDIYQSGGLSHRLFFFALWFIPIIEPLLCMYKHFHTKIKK